MIQIELGHLLIVIKCFKKTLKVKFLLTPYKKIFITTKDDKILEMKFSNVKVDAKRITCIEKYVDCWNCIIASLQAVVTDREVGDDDLILFKHESVFLNDLFLFKIAIHKMFCGSNMIVRTYFGGSTSDIFLVKVAAIKKAITRLSSLTHIPAEQYVERMLHEYISTKISRKYCIELGTTPLTQTNISTWGSNGFGFYHLHRYFQFVNSLNIFVDFFGQKFWKKENYHQLFDGNHEI